LDLVVLTSLWEGLPRVIPEATIAGVPVIASDIDGNREIIHPGRNGALAIPGNALDFAAKIEQALNQSWTVDPQLAANIREEFDIDRMVRLQEDLYCNLTSYVSV
jgi:glycosyltransferase involved in cell wall biosynthesis